MNTLHYLISIILTLVAAFASMFYLGSQEEHKALMVHHFPATFSLHFCAGVLVGLVGVACWWLLLLLLAKAGWVREATLGSKMVRVAIGPVGGALVGALVFCLA